MHSLFSAAYNDERYIVWLLQVLFGEAALSIYSLQGYPSPGADKTVITLGVRMHPIIRRTIRFVGKYKIPWEEPDERNQFVIQWESV